MIEHDAKATIIAKPLYEQAYYLKALTLTADVICSRGLNIMLLPSADRSRLPISARS